MGHWNYPLIGSSQVNHNKVFIFHILFFLYFFFFLWRGWPSGITGNTLTWKILSSNPTDGLGKDRIWAPHYEAPDPLQVGHVECVPLTISYPLFFLCISKVSSMLHHGSVRWFHSNECYLIKFSNWGERLTAPKLLKGLLGKSIWLFSGRKLQFSHKK